MKVQVRESGNPTMDFRPELGPLFAFVYGRIGGDREAAEDLTQETLLAALQGRFDPARGSLRPWLFGIALRKIVDRQRHQRVLRDHAASVARELAVRMIREPLPDEWIERDEVRALVNEALACLGEEEAFLLARKYSEGVGVAELAAESSETEKAVESRLTRARLALHEAIERIAGPDWEFEP